MVKKASSKDTKVQLEVVNTEITKVLNTMADQSNSIGENIIQGIIVGKNPQKQALSQAATDLVSATVTAAKKAGKINSPSGLMRDEVGKYLALGIGVGFEDEINNVNKQIQDSINSDFNVNPNLLGGITDSKAMNDIEKSISNTYANSSFTSPITIKMGYIHVNSSVNDDTVSKIRQLAKDEAEDVLNKFNSYITNNLVSRVNQNIYT